MTKTTNSKLKDFDLEELLGSTKSHTERIESLEGRVADLEQNISNNFWFAEKFVNSQKEQKQIDEAIKGIIKEYDNHNLKVNGAALAKWVGATGWWTFGSFNHRVFQPIAERYIFAQLLFIFFRTILRPACFNSFLSRGLPLLWRLARTRLFFAHVTVQSDR